MSTVTSIEWADVVWNPVTGCSKVSEGCRNCYAEAVAHRFWGEREFTDVQRHEDRLEQPLHWKKPRRIFVNSMSDLFHEDVPDEFIERIWATMACADWHTFQILTKRPERMHRFLCVEDHWDQIGRHVVDLSPFAAKRGLQRKANGQKIFGHVWLGVSIEDQQTADERIPILLQVPSAVRWVSAEPLLGPVDLDSYLSYVGQVLSHGGLDWLVVGGESGPGARHCDAEWIRSIVGQCQEAGVPCFVKQLGANVYDGNRPMSGQDCIPSKRNEFAALTQRAGRDMVEWPADLRVREWPR